MAQFPIIEGDENFNYTGRDGLNIFDNGSRQDLYYPTFDFNAVWVIKVGERPVILENARIYPASHFPKFNNETKDGFRITDAQSKQRQYFIGFNLGEVWVIQSEQRPTIRISARILPEKTFIGFNNLEKDGVSITDIESKQRGTYVKFDFTEIWEMVENKTRPKLIIDTINLQNNQLRVFVDGKIYSIPLIEDIGINAFKVNIGGSDYVVDNSVIELIKS